MEYTNIPDDVVYTILKKIIDNGTNKEALLAAACCRTTYTYWIDAMFQSLPKFVIMQEPYGNQEYEVNLILTQEETDIFIDILINKSVSVRELWRRLKPDGRLPKRFTIKFFLKYRDCSWEQDNTLRNNLMKTSLLTQLCHYIGGSCLYASIKLDGMIDKYRVQGGWSNKCFNAGVYA